MKNFILFLIGFISFWYLIGYSIGSIPGWENMNGAFTKFMQTFYLKTGENLSVSGNLSIANGQICVNGICHGDAEGTKTCRINQTDIKWRGCPNGSYLSHIWNTHGYCRYLNDYSAEADYIQSNEDACQWDTTFLALMYNGTPPYITNVEGNVLINTGGTTISASQYDELLSGSIIETSANSFATIVFWDNSVIRLNENTKVVLVYDISNTTARLEGGELWARVLRPFTQWSAFTVETWDLSAGVRGTSVYARRTNTGSAIAVLDSASESSSAPTKVIYGSNTVEINPGTLLQIPRTGAVKKVDLDYSLAYISPFVRNSIKDDTLYMEWILEQSGASRDPKKVALELYNTYQHISDGVLTFIDDPIIQQQKNLTIQDKLKKQIAIDLTEKYIVDTDTKNSIISEIRFESGVTNVTKDIIKKYKDNWIFAGTGTNEQNIGEIIYGNTKTTKYKSGRVLIPDIEFPTANKYAAIQLDGKWFYRIRSRDWARPTKFVNTAAKYENSKWSKWYKITESIPMQKLACEFDKGKNKTQGQYTCNTCVSTKVDKTTGEITLRRYAIKTNSIIPNQPGTNYTMKCDKTNVLGTIKVNPIEWVFTPAVSSIAIAVDNPTYYQNQKDITSYLEKVNLEEIGIVSSDVVGNILAPNVTETIQTIETTESAQVKEEIDANNDGIPETVNLWIPVNQQLTWIEFTIPGVWKIQLNNQWFNVNGKKVKDFDDDWKDDDGKNKKWFGWD